MAAPFKKNMMQNKEENQGIKDIDSYLAGYAKRGEEFKDLKEKINLLLDDFYFGRTDEILNETSSGQKDIEDKVWNLAKIFVNELSPRDLLEITDGSDFFDMSYREAKERYDAWHAKKCKR